MFWTAIRSCVGIPLVREKAKHAGVFFNLSGQQIPRRRDRHKNFWNSWCYNFVSFKGVFRKLIKAIINSWFQKYFGLSISMVTSHVTPLWPIKTSRLPKVSPSKMWYFAEILCIQNWRACPIWNLKRHNWWRHKMSLLLMRSTNPKNW